MTAENERVKILLGKVTEDVSKSFYKFVEAFRGNVIFALNHLITSNSTTNEHQASVGMKNVLAVDVQKSDVEAIYDMIDHFISKRKLLSRGDAIEILIYECGIQWLHDDSMRFSVFKMETMRKLNEDRTRNEFCDFAISVQSKATGDVKLYHAHKCVLAVESSHFRSILQKSTQLVQIFTVIEPHLVGLILDFIYTGEIKLDSNNCSNVYYLANQLGVDNLVELCKNYFTLSHNQLESITDIVVTNLLDSTDVQEHATDEEASAQQKTSQQNASDSEEKVSSTSPIPVHKSKRKPKKSESVIHMCNLCKAFFTRKSHLNRHMLSHYGERKHCCTTCGKLFVKSDHLIRHERSHSTERPFRCGICDKRFKTKAVLKRHGLTHEDDRPYFCEICGKQFKDKTALLVHQKTHMAGKFSCQYCQKAFSRKSQLLSHVVSHTNPPSCKSCGKQFKYRSQLVRHEIIHTDNRPFSCESCGKQFYDMRSLKLHQRRHTGLDMHECSQCDKKFTDNYHLTRHMKIHTGEKSYRCVHCKKAFSRADNCKFHESSCASKCATAKRKGSSTGQSMLKVKSKSLIYTKKKPLIVAKPSQTSNMQVVCETSLDVERYNGGRYIKIAKKP